MIVGAVLSTTATLKVTSSVSPVSFVAVIVTSFVVPDTAVPASGSCVTVTVVSQASVVTTVVVKSGKLALQPAPASIV